MVLIRKAIPFEISKSKSHGWKRYQENSKTDPIVCRKVECLSPNSLVPKFRYPSSNLGSPFSISIKKRRKGYTIPCLWEEEVVHYNVNQCVWLRLDSKSKNDLPELPTDSGLSLEAFLVAALCSSTSWRRSQIWLDQIFSFKWRRVFLTYHPWSNFGHRFYQVVQQCPTVIMSLLLSYHLPFLQIRGKCWVPATY